MVFLKITIPFLITACGDLALPQVDPDVATEQPETTPSETAPSTESVVSSDKTTNTIEETEEVQSIQDDTVPEEEINSVTETPTEPVDEVVDSSAEATPIVVVEEAPPENLPPTFTPVEAVTAQETMEAKFAVQANDPENMPLSISCLNCPGYAFDAETGVFRWFPGYSDAGEHTFTFEASDGVHTVTQDVPVTVLNLNRAPGMLNIPSQNVEEFTTVTFRVVVGLDPDVGDVHTRSITNAPAGSTFDPDDGTFVWESAVDGVWTITATVSDGTDSVSQDVVITVNNINRAPTLAGIGSQNVAEQSTLTLNLAADDPDGETLVYSADALPTGASLTDNVFTYTPPCNTPSTALANHTESITFSVTDGDLTDSETVAFSVTDTDCGGPTWANVMDATKVSQNSIDFRVHDLVVNNEDDDVITYEYYADFSCNDETVTVDFDTSTAPPPSQIIIDPIQTRDSIRRVVFRASDPYGNVIFRAVDYYYNSSNRWSYINTQEYAGTWDSATHPDFYAWGDAVMGVGNWDFCEISGSPIYRHTTRADQVPTTTYVLP